MASPNVCRFTWAGQSVPASSTLEMMINLCSDGVVDFDIRGLPHWEGLQRNKSLIANAALTALTALAVNGTWVCYCGGLGGMVLRIPHASCGA